MLLRPTHPLLTIALAVGAALSLSPQSLISQPPPDPQADFIHRIDLSVAARFQSLAGYTVQEHYSIYRNADTAPAAEMTVAVVYTPEHGKQYTPISQSGSEIFRHLIFDKIIASERDMNLASARAGYFINSTNYQMQVPAETVLRNGRPCYLVTLKARRKSPYLFDGKAWFDSADASIVRLEGTPTEPSSFLTANTVVARDYTSLQGISMATRAQANTRTFLFGDTILKIDYLDYHLQLAPAALPEAISVPRR